MSTWQRGPDVLVSTKTQFSSYLNNKNNRYEEAVGEATNLRDRYPMAAMGFAFLVRVNVFDERARSRICGTSSRACGSRTARSTRRCCSSPTGTTTLNLSASRPGARSSPSDDPEPMLSAPRFFRDLLDAVMDNTPVDIHTELRLRKQGEPEGGMPPEDEDVAPERLAHPVRGAAGAGAKSDARKPLY